MGSGVVVGEVGGGGWRVVVAAERKRNPNVEKTTKEILKFDLRGDDLCMW